MRDRQRARVRGDRHPVQASPLRSGEEDRSVWVQAAERLARPVLEAGAAGQLRASIPVEVGPTGSEEDRSEHTHLEAVARLLCGLAPWLELPDDVGDREERRLRRRFRDLAQQTLRCAADPTSPDRFQVTGTQPLVEAAFLAIAVKRAPRSLWEELDGATRQGLVCFLLETRRVQPHFNNWLLFSAAVEMLLRLVGDERWDPVRIDYAMRQHDAWYRGDGVYGDGPLVRMDFYNSYVIHPLLLEVSDVVEGESREWGRLASEFRRRSQRYAEVLERMVAPDGTFPVWGRSLAYRFGVLHALGCVSLRHELPAELRPGTSRSLMTAVLRRQLDAPGTFDEEGWLRIGLAGHQPSLAEPYISTGSLYLCATGLVPLGLSPSDAFWSDPPGAWTSRRAWSGEAIDADVAMEKRRRPS